MHTKLRYDTFLQEKKSILLIILETTFCESLNFPYKRKFASFQIYFMELQIETQTFRQLFR